MVETERGAFMNAQLCALADLVCQESRVYAAFIRGVAELVDLAQAEHGCSGIEQFVLLELAGTCAMGQGAAGGRVADAWQLTRMLPAILAGLERGSVNVGQARVVLAGTRNCSEQVGGEVARRLLAIEPAGIELMCPADLRRRVAALVVQVEAELEPAVTAERLADARASRRVLVRPEPDQMGSVFGLLPAEQLRGFAVGLDELARRQRTADQQAGLARTADQRRADLLAMLPSLALHALDSTTPTPATPAPCPTPGAAGGAAVVGAGVGGPAGCAPHPAVQIVVHVPVATALGLSAQPGQLEGHGPLDADTIRQLLPDAVLRRLAVDSTTGQPVHTDPATRPPAGHRPAGNPRAARQALLGMLNEPVTITERPEPGYHPPAGLARLVRLRDQRCSGPGCSQPASRCDLDHRQPWPDGKTSAANLRATSRRCHRAKTINWQVRDYPDGQTTWTSPLGRAYTRPPPWTAPPAIHPHVQLPPPPDRRAPDRPAPAWAHSNPDLDDNGLSADLDPPDTPTPPATTPTGSSPTPTGRGWSDEPPF